MLNRLIAWSLTNRVFVLGIQPVAEVSGKVRVDLSLK